MNKDLDRRVRQLEEQHRNLLQPKSKARFVTGGRGLRKFCKLVEDAEGEYGPVWARITNRTGDENGTLFQLYYWDSGIAGAKPGYKCTWQWLDGEQVIETGFCPAKCETTGQIGVSSLGPATVDSPFTADISVSNADAGTVSASDLPPGLSVDGDGAITGTPTTAGTFYPVFTVTADKTGSEIEEKCTVSKLIPITVDPAPEPI